MPQGERERKVKYFSLGPPQQVQGRSPWRAFGDFRRETKVTRGGGAERPLVGSAEGQRPSHIGPRRGPRPCKNLRGRSSPPSTYTPKRTKSCTPTCNRQGKNLPSAGKNLRCAVAETRIGRAIMAQQKSEGIFPRFFAAYSKFSGAFDIPSHSRAPCCGCAWRSRLRRFPAG